MIIENLPTITPKDFGYLNDPAKPILSLDFYADKPHRSEAHNHPRAQIILPIEGVYRINTPKGSWLVPPQQAVWIPGELEHEIYANQAVRSYMFFVDQSFKLDNMDDCLVVELDALLKELLFRLIEIGNDYAANDRQARLVNVLLDELSTLKRATIFLPYGVDKRLRAVMEDLIANPGISKLDELANKHACSQRNLTRLFVNETGLTFSQWRQKLVVMESIERFACGDSVTLVSQEMGYSSSSAFSYMFKQVTGLNPLHFFNFRKLV